MNKSADIGVKTLLFLVLAIIAFGPLAMAGVRALLHLPTRGQSDFRELTSIAVEIGKGPEGTMESMLFMIDGKGFGAAFSKDSDRVQLQSGPYKRYFERPAEGCAKGKACMCYCKNSGIDTTPITFLQKFPGPAVTKGLIGSDKLECKSRPECTELDSIEFPSYLDKQHFGADGKTVFNYHLEGGLLFGPGAESAVYVEKGKGDMVGICYVRPCTQ